MIAGLSTKLRFNGESRTYALLLAAFGVFICRLALSLAFVPPWQQSDEPPHVAYVEVARSRLTSVRFPDPGRQREILLSMARFGWWQHYGLQVPMPFPVRFGTDERAFAPEDEDRAPQNFRSIGIDPAAKNSNAAYYAIVATMLAPAPALSVVADLYVMRVFSAALGLLTLWLAWRGARECVGETGGATVTMLLALHPQLAIVSTTASPDMLANVCAAGFWWQAMVALRRTNFIGPLAFAWAFAIGSAVADRMAIPLLAAACVTSVVCTARHSGLRRGTLSIAMVAILLLALSLWAIEAVWHTFSGALNFAVDPVPSSERWSYFVRFTTFLFQGWWSSLGLVRHVPPAWWQVIALMLSILGALGVAHRFIWSGSQIRLMVVLAVMVVSIQIAAVFWIFFTVENPHGRYLFPSLVPTLVLLWMGIEAWVPLRGRPYAAIGLVLLFALLDMTVWEFVALPVWGT